MPRDPEQCLPVLFCPFCGAHGVSIERSKLTRCNSCRTVFDVGYCRRLRRKARKTTATDKGDDHAANDTNSATVHRLVGKRLIDHTPKVGQLVIVHVRDVMTFSARLRLIGDISQCPYWEIAGTEGERLRKCNQNTDMWCYLPDIELPKIRWG